jgi:hypothetical protein
LWLVTVIIMPLASYAPPTQRVRSPVVATLA